MKRLVKAALRRLGGGLAGLGRDAAAKPATEPPGPIFVNDTFILWLTFANAGMLHTGNVYSFDYAIRNLPSDAPILEIGAFCGLSANAINYFKRRHKAPNRLITIDKWLFEGAALGYSVGESSITHDEYQAFVKETFRRNLRFFSRDDLPYAVEMLSDEFFQAWREGRRVRDVFEREIGLGGKVSFCYVDGNHTYEFVRRDFEHCDEFLEPGGFLLFDDSADGSGWDVCKVMREVESGGRYELVIKNPNYLFRKK
jgi:hypothetical protein